MKRLFLFLLLIISIGIVFSLNYNYFNIFQEDLDQNSLNVESSSSTDKQLSNSQIKKQTSKTSNKVSKPKVEKKFDFLGNSVSENEIKSWYFSSEQVKGYLISFNYECIHLTSDGKTDLTLFIDTTTGNLKSVKEGNNCDLDVYVEESLIEDIKKDGFQAKNIKQYLEKVDLPWTTYAKAVKVFTVG